MAQLHNSNFTLLYQTSNFIVCTPAPPRINLCIIRRILLHWARFSLGTLSCQTRLRTVASRSFYELSEPEGYQSTRESVICLFIPLPCLLGALSDQYGTYPRHHLSVTPESTLSASARLLFTWSVHLLPKWSEPCSSSDALHGMYLFLVVQCACDSKKGGKILSACMVQRIIPAG